MADDGKGDQLPTVRIVLPLAVLVPLWTLAVCVVLLTLWAMGR